MADDQKANRLGDTLDHGRAGRVEADAGDTQGGSPSHERATFNDPITESESDLGASPDRTRGAFSDTPDRRDPHADDFTAGQVHLAESNPTGAILGNHASPMHGAGTPVRRPHGDGLVGSTADSSGTTPERDMHKAGAKATNTSATEHTGEPMDRNDRDRLDAVDASGKGPKTNDIIHHDDHPGVGDHVGEAAGGISGVLTGAAIGSVGGPIGTIIGGIAGAIGGWWSGRAISEAATRFTHSDDDFYRNHYEAHPNRLADRKYEDVRPAYQVGHLASQNPDYANREWSDVERDLQHGWSDDMRAKHGDWNAVSPYAKDAWTRGRSGLAAGGLGATAGATAGAAGHGLADKVDDLKDRVDGNPASRPGADATDSSRRASEPGASPGYGATSTPGATGRTDLDDRARNTADRVGDKAENLWDRTKAGAERLGDKVADKADDLKDRVDGNPNTRPDVDRTDDSDRRF